MSSNAAKQARRFHEPLVEGDTPNQTVGCRHTNPVICGRNGIPSRCAFARTDNICLAPPMTWPKQYEKLRSGSGRSRP